MNSQHQLITTLISRGVVTFGQFTTKSGRSSPFFFNMGLLCTGGSLAIFAEAFARTIDEHFGPAYRYLFGPAYKGIPLVVATADRLQQRRGADIFFTFNRKEKKTHGEVGELVGHPYEGGEPVIIVEDVLTAGTSVRESIALLRRYGAVPAGVVVGVDRQERGLGSTFAREELSDEFSLPVICLLDAHQILAYTEIRQGE